MGAEPDPRAEQASALRRPRRVGCDRHRFDVEASGAAQGAAGRGVELANHNSSCPAKAGDPVTRAVRFDRSRHGVLDRPLQCAIAHKAGDDLTGYLRKPTMTEIRVPTLRE